MAIVLKRMTWLYLIAAMISILPAYQVWWGALVTNVRPDSGLMFAMAYLWPDVVALGFAVFCARRSLEVVAFWLAATLPTYIARTSLLLNSSLPAENLNPPLVIADFAHTLVVLVLGLAIVAVFNLIKRRMAAPR